MTPIDWKYLLLAIYIVVGLVIHFTSDLYEVRRRFFLTYIIMFIMDVFLWPMWILIVLSNYFRKGTWKM